MIPIIVRAFSLLEPAEIDKEAVGFSERLGMSLAFAFIEEAVSLTFVADQFARPFCLLHHTLERDNGIVGNRGVLLAM